MLSTSTEVNEIAAALAKAQLAMRNAIKDAVNPAFKSKYANLAAVRDATNEPLASNGIACVQAPSVGDGVVSVETRLVHASGQWMSCTIAAVPRDGSPQSVGSAVTYLRRYGLLAMAGIAPDDDDGHASQGDRPAPIPQRRDHPPQGQGHDASFSDADRRAFMAALTERGVKYDDLKAFCAAMNRPKPSEMGKEGRQKIVAYLDSEAGKRKFDTFVHTGEIAATESK